MMNEEYEESTAINSPHNKAGRRKGVVTEIDQVAGVVESSLHENEINSNQQVSREGIISLKEREQHNK